MEVNKVKILYTIPNFDTAGSGIPLLTIAKKLDKKLFIPEIACLHKKGELFKDVIESGIKVHIVDLYKNARPILNMFQECYHLSRIFKEINPHIIHSYHYAADYSEPIAAKMAGIKWIYTKKNMSWFGPSFRRWKLRSFLANGIITQNSDMMRDFFSRKRNISLIPIGIDVKKYKLNKIKSNKRYLLTIANLIEIKGIHILIQSFFKIHNNFPDWSLLIVGDDRSSYGKYCHNLVTALSLKHKIIFTGKVKNVTKYLNQAEIFVLPSINGEGGPISILEAMANEKNIIASNVAGIRDQLINFKDHMFECGNENSLILKLESFMKCTTLENNQQGKLFYNHVLKNYNISIELNRLQQYYTNLVNK